MGKRYCKKHLRPGSEEKQNPDQILSVINKRSFSGSTRVLYEVIRGSYENDPEWLEVDENQLLIQKYNAFEATGIFAPGTVPYSVIKNTR